jgi:amidase/aspartyl-tRNA(Asn)/glutamyl-tRNA(Gln) amidotransferase subunit A
VAVAAGLAPFAIGTDTGGSIRVPSAFCGLYGFRTVPHHEWIADAFPLARSYDTAGWFTANAGDMALVITELLGPPSQSANEPRGAWIELPGLDPEVGAVFRSAADRLAPRLADDLAALLLSAFAPAAALYGVLGAAEAWQLHADWFGSYAFRYDPIVRQRLENASRLAPDQIHSARESEVRLRAAWAAFFENHDFMVLPASPFPALKKTECHAENRSRLLSLTTPVSLAGLPALTVPLNLPGSPLTTGLQIVTRHLDSPAFAHALRSP